VPSQGRPRDLWPVLDVPVAALVSLLALLLVPLDAPPLVRVPVGLAALFLAPGYAWSRVLFATRAGSGSGLGVDGGAASPMSGPMRFAVGLALSTAILVLVVITVEALGPLRPQRVLAALAAVTVAATAVWVVRSKPGLPGPSDIAGPAVANTGGSRTLGILLVASMVLAGLAGGYALLKPRDAPAFTQLYLTATDGQQHCFPDRFVQGAYAFDPREADECEGAADILVVGVANHEGKETEYWLRAVWTREVLTEENLTEVLEVQPIRSWQVSLESVKAPDDPQPHEAQYEVPLELPPPPGNGSWRMSVQLYTATPPPLEPSIAFLESPYRRVQILIEAA
jgi:uncharacterized membrane protein